MGAEDRPDLLDAPPTVGARVVRAAAPVPVVVVVRWSDLLVEELHGEATHWAYPHDGAAPVVHCRLHGCRYNTQIETWFPAVDVTRSGAGSARCSPGSDAREPPAVT